VLVVWPPPCTKGNKAYSVLAGSLIVKTAGSIQERLARRHVRDPLARGEGLKLSTELPVGSLALARASLQGAATRTRGSLHASRYLGRIPESSTRVCISLPYSLASAFILQSWFCVLLSSLVIS
jgi:hypothetical protein